MSTLKALKTKIIFSKWCKGMSFKTQIIFSKWYKEMSSKTQIIFSKWCTGMSFKTQLFSVNDIRRCLPNILLAFHWSDVLQNSQTAGITPRAAQHHHSHHCADAQPSDYSKNQTGRQQEAKLQSQPCFSLSQKPNIPGRRQVCTSGRRPGSAPWSQRSLFVISPHKGTWSEWGLWWAGSHPSTVQTECSPPAACPGAPAWPWQQSPSSCIPRIHSPWNGRWARCRPGNTSPRCHRHEPVPQTPRCWGKGAGWWCRAEHPWAGAARRSPCHAGNAGGISWWRSGPAPRLTGWQMLQERSSGDITYPTPLPPPETTGDSCRFTPNTQ